MSCHDGDRDVFQKGPVNPVQNSSGRAMGHHLTSLSGLRRTQKSVQIQNMKISKDESVSAHQRRAREVTQPGKDSEERSAAG